MDAVPGEVVVGEPLPVILRMVDEVGGVVTTNHGSLRLQAFVPLPEWPVISEVDWWGQVVEVFNPGRDPVELSGWELLVGYGTGLDFYPHARLQFPPGTVCDPGGALTWAGTADSPGGPHDWVSTTHFHLPGQMFRAVRLLDANGAARDEVNLAPAQQLAVLKLWRGDGLPLVLATNVVFSRVGDANRFQRGDWVTNLPPSLGARNARLNWPWQNRRAWSVPTPSTVTLSNGVWSGTVSFPVPGEGTVLVADNGAGLQAQSTPIRVHPLPALTLLVPEAIRTAREAGAGPLGEVTLVLPQPLSTNLPVTLSWDAEQEFTSPESLVVPAGTTRFTFAVTNLDDSWADGLAQVQLTASAPGHALAVAVFWNVDDETGDLHITLPTSLKEGEGWAREPGRVWLEDPVHHDVRVQLTSEPPLEAPSTVIIPAGRSSATFDLYVADDPWVNPLTIQGPMNFQVPLSARTADWPAVTAFQTVRDNESPWLTIEAPAEMLEGTSAQGMIRLQAPRPQPFVVLISSPDQLHRERLGLPLEVQVPAGVTDQPFTLHVPQNDQPEPELRIELYAWWQGIGGNTEAYVRVLDDDTELVGIELLGYPSNAVLSGLPFRVGARLVNEFGSTYRADLSGRLELLASPEAARLAPGNELIQFVRGVWEGEITIHGEALGVPLRVTAANLSAEGRPLDILRGREHRIAFADLQWWPAAAQFLVLETGAASLHRLAELDPLTGARGRTLDLPHPANLMTLAEDGTAAWLAAPGRLLRVDLTHWRLDGVFALDPETPGALASALLVLSGGADRVLAAVASDEWGTNFRLQLYTAGVRQPDTVPLAGPIRSALLVAGRQPTEAFGYNWGTIHRFEVTDSGVRLAGSHWFNGTANLALVGDWLVGDSGEIASADTLQPGERLPVPVESRSCLVPGRPWVAYLDHNQALTFLNVATHQRIGGHATPAADATVGRLLAWGSRGLALTYPGPGLIVTFESPLLGTGLRRPGGELAGARPPAAPGNMADRPAAPHNQPVPAEQGAARPRADLGVLLVSMPENVVVGQEFTVTGVLTNAGPDELPAISFGFWGAPNDEYAFIACPSCSQGPDGGWVMGGLAPGATLSFTARFRAAQPGLHVLAIYGHVDREDPNAQNDFVGTAFLSVPEVLTGDTPGRRLPGSGRFAWDPQSRLILATFGGLSGLVTLEPETLTPVHQVVRSGQVTALAACGDGQHAWLFGDDGFTRVNYQTGTADLHLTGEPTIGLWHMASPPGQPDLLVLITGDNRVSAHHRGILLPEIYGPVHDFGRLLFTSDGRLWVAANGQLRELQITPNGVAEVRNLDSVAVARWSTAAYSEAAGRLFSPEGHVIDIATGQRVTDTGPRLADPEIGLAFEFFTPGPPLEVQSFDAQDFEPLWRISLPAEEMVLTLGRQGFFTRRGAEYWTFPLPNPDTRQTDLRLTVSLPDRAHGVGYLLPLELSLTNRSLWAAPAARIEVGLSPGLEFAPDQPFAGASNTVIGLGTLVEATNLTLWLRPVSVGPQEVRVVVSSAVPDATPEDDSQRLETFVPEPPRLLVDDYALLEGQPLRVWLSRPAPEAITVPFAIRPATAQPRDFGSLNGVFVFGPDQQTASFEAVVSDRDPEFDEIATIELGPAPRVFLSRTNITLTILNDDWPEVRIADAEIRRLLSGRTDATLRFTLDRPAPFPVEAWFRLLPGTAAPGRDYLHREGWIVFPPGVSLRTVTVPVLADTENTADQAAFVSLVEVRNGLPGTTTAQLTIRQVHRPVLVLRVLPTNQLAIEYSTAAGTTYQVQHTTNLVIPNWRPLGNPRAGTGLPAAVPIGEPLEAESYFRVVAQ